jgi:hypothetical protein
LRAVTFAGVGFFRSAAFPSFRCGVLDGGAFRAGAFFGAAFFTAAFLAAGFLATGFFTAGFLAGVFFASGFFGPADWRVGAGTALRLAALDAAGEREEARSGPVRPAGRAVPAAADFGLPAVFFGCAFFTTAFLDRAPDPGVVPAVRDSPPRVTLLPAADPPVAGLPAFAFFLTAMPTSRSGAARDPTDAAGGSIVMPWLWGIGDPMQQVCGRSRTAGPGHSPREVAPL